MFTLRHVFYLDRNLSHLRDNVKLNISEIQTTLEILFLDATFYRDITVGLVYTNYRQNDEK